MHSLEPMLCNKRSQCNQKPKHRNERVFPTRCNQGQPLHSNENPAQTKINNNKEIKSAMMITITIMISSKLNWFMCRHRFLKFNQLINVLDCVRSQFWHEGSLLRPTGSLVLVCWCHRAWASIVAAWGFPGGSDYKKSASNVGDLSSIPGLGRFPGEGHGSPFQYSCLENLHGQQSLVGYGPWDCKELDTTK